MRTLARGVTLLICAAGRGLLVCGRPPGHKGRHRDIEWPVSWEGQ